MRTMADSGDQDEMLHNAAFHQCLNCLLSQKWSFEKYNFILEIITCDPSIITIDHWTIPSLLNQNRRKNPLVYKGLNGRA